MVKGSRGGQPPPDVPPGWTWLSTRGYTLEARASYALRWIQARAGPQTPPNSPPGRYSGRVTSWELVPPDGITFHDELYHAGKLQMLGEERYRFMGAEQSGSIAEVIMLRKPISLLARFGHALDPRASVRNARKEAELFDDIDHDYREGSGPR
jgi:hypothetical protein